MSDNDTRAREDHRYPQVVRFVRDTPWAILETKLLEIEEMVAVRASGGHLTVEEIQARINGNTARKDSYASAGGVAVIPVYGVITPKADLMTEMSGGTSVDRVQAALQAALDDDKVAQIVLDINSPGGSVAMIPELAAQIRAARREKPVVAVANTMAASAAYWWASQASEIVVTPSGSVGSIGVIAAHDDISQAQEKLGVKTTLVTAGKYKGEKSPYAPLTEEAKADIQKTVDGHYAMFTQDVARGRGVSVETVRADFGQGRMLLARDAVNAGMADRVATLDQVLASFAKATKQPASITATTYLNGATVASTAYSGSGTPPPIASTPSDFEAAESGLSFAQEADALRDSADALLNRTRSLAEYRDRGRLGPAKRERLAACTEALRETVTALEGVMADTAPVNKRTPEDVIGAFLERISGKAA